MPFTEIEAFCRFEQLTAQEGRAIRALSEAYVDGLRRGTDVFSVPPWGGDG